MTKHRKSKNGRGKRQPTLGDKVQFLSFDPIPELPGMFRTKRGTVQGFKPDGTVLIQVRGKMHEIPPNRVTLIG